MDQAFFHYQLMISFEWDRFEWDSGNNMVLSPIQRWPCSGSLDEAALLHDRDGVLVGWVVMESPDVLTLQLGSRFTEITGLFI